MVTGYLKNPTLVKGQIDLTATCGKPKGWHLFDPWPVDEERLHSSAGTAAPVEAAVVFAGRSHGLFIASESFVLGPFCIQIPAFADLW